MPAKAARSSATRSGSQPGPGAEESSIWVYGCCGRRSISAVWFCSTSWPLVHHQGPVGHLADHREVVADEHQADAEGGTKVVEQSKDLRLDRDVQRGHGLVKHKYFRLDCKGSRDRYSLPLATTELVRPGVGEFRGETDLVEQPGDLGRRLRFRQFTLVAVQYVPQTGLDAQPPVEGRVRILEDHLDPTSPLEASRLATPGAMDLPAADRDRALVGAGEADQHPGDGRLTRTRLTDDTEGLAGCQRERDLVRGNHRRGTAPAGVGLPEVGDFENVHG